jgi:hypothetical protein
MYGDMNSKRPENLPDASIYGENKHFFEKYSEVFTQAQIFNIYSFLQIGLFDPFPTEQIDTEF